MASGKGRTLAGGGSRSDIDGRPGAGKIQPSVTTANIITILRILLVPFFVVEVLYYARTGQEAHRWLAIATFAVAASCDGVDGYIARRYNQRSELGAILDPLADKLLLVSGIVVLSMQTDPYLRPIPLWLTGTVIGRDILLLVGLVVIQMMVGKVKVRPRILGKMATVLQMSRGALEPVEVGRQAASLLVPRGGDMHRHFGPALRLGRHAPIERAPGQFPGAQAVRHLTGRNIWRRVSSRGGYSTLDPWMSDCL